MAKHIFKNAYLMINAVDLSDRAKTITLDYTDEVQDDTAHQSDSRTRLAGLTDFSLTVEWFQDYAVAEVDATLFGLIGAATFAVSMRPDAGVQSATNPTFAGNVILENYQPMGGTVGDVHMSPTTFRGNGDLSRTAV